MSPIHVLVVNEKTYETSVGPFGRAYDFQFADLLNLIRVRNGHEQKRLEYRKP